MTTPPAESSTAQRHLPPGTTAAERIGRVRFPAYRLVTGDQTVATLGRYSWLNVYFGFGQRIVLDDGARWRVKAIEYGGSLCPVVADASNHRVAMATPGAHEGGRMGPVGYYGIDGPDYGYRLNAADGGLGRPGRWLLTEHEEAIAVVTRRPNAITARGETPLGGALLCLMLARFGMPGDADLGAPRFHWD
jgi:hypothetical protein